MARSAQHKSHATSAPPRACGASALLIVRALTLAQTRGTLTFGAVTVPCALGRSGRRMVKREGDGATPRGTFALRRLLFRADHGPRPRCALAARPIRPDDGWCDSPRHALYNRFVRHPVSISAEHLWRADRLYDVVIVIGHNDRPRRPGGGSAIFLHVARDGFSPTEGCVALSPADLRRLLPRLSRSTRIRIV